MALDGDPTTRIEALKALLRRAQARGESRSSDVVFFPEGYERDLLPALAESTHQSFTRVSVCSAPPNDAETFRDQVAGELASIGVGVKHLLIVSHLGLLAAGVADRALAELSAGCQVRILPASLVPESLGGAARNQILIDQQLLAAPPALAGGTHDWAISVQAAAVEAADDQIESLWSLGYAPADLPDQLSLEEPLVQSATVLASVAPVLCSGDHIDSTDCSWYHGTWQFLRLMNLVSTPTWHQDFYTSALRERLLDGAKSVCVTGTADYSVVAFVLDAVARTGSNATVTVVDMCQTPLFAVQWYAKRVGVTITCVAQDVIEFAEDKASVFDLIVTDAFLTRFSGTDVDNVLAAWSRMLTSSGCVVTTIRSHAESARAQSQDQAVQGFAERARLAWHRWDSFIPFTATEIAERAEVYARRMISNPIGHSDEIVEKLTGWFDVTSSSLADVPGELFPTRYLRVVLTNGRS